MKLSCNLKGDEIISYYDFERNEVLKFIPKNVKNILEVGCGTGRFAVSLRREIKCEYWGIEPFAEAAAIASKSLDKVIIGSIENNIDLLPKNYFDCVIFNDVLEHLVNPFDTLQKLYQILPVGCKIISSIPNVLYFFNMKDLLLKKDWEYTHQGGILDFTHLRFFTKKSMVRIFCESGYKIQKIEGINPIQLWISLPLNILTLGHFNESKFMQFVVIAEKTI